jgi:hypothetical protein
MLARASSKSTELNWTEAVQVTKSNDTRPLFRVGARYRQNSNCHTAINIWSWAPDRARNQDAMTDWSSVVMWLWLWLWPNLTYEKHTSILRSKMYTIQKASLNKSRNNERITQSTSKHYIETDNCVKASAVLPLEKESNGSQKCW